MITQSSSVVHQKNPKNEPSDHSVVARRAILMALGTLSSRILGLLRDMTFAALFPKMVTDAWGVAWRVPNLFRRVMGEGSMSASFLPVFVESRLAEPEHSRRLLGQFATLLWIVLFTITAMGMIEIRPLTSLLVGTHFDNLPGKFELTVHMGQIMLGFLFLVSTSALFSCVLQALGIFGWPALAPAIFNVVMILFNFIPTVFGYAGDTFASGETLAWGVLAGGLCQMLVLIPLLVRRGYLPKLQWPRLTQAPSRELGLVLKNMLPGVIGLGLLQGLGIINTRLAAGVGEGSNTFLYLTDRLLEFPLSLVSVSLGTALLPTLSEHWSKKEVEKLKSTAASMLSLNLFISIPAAVALWVLAKPIVAILFGHGNFGAQDVEITAQVVQVSAWTLVVSSLSRVTMPIFYSMKNTWIPALSSVVAMSLHILMAGWWVSRWGLSGLMISTALCLSLQVLLLAMVLTKDQKLFPWRELWQSCWRFSLNSLPIFIFGWTLDHSWSQLGKSLQWTLLFLVIAASVGVYFWLAKKQKLSQADFFKERLF